MTCLPYTMSCYTHTQSPMTPHFMGKTTEVSWPNCLKVAGLEFQVRLSAPEAKTHNAVWTLTPTTGTSRSFIP